MEIIGAFIVWVFSGFKKSFKHYRNAGGKMYVFNILIGFIVTFSILILITNLF